VVAASAQVADDADLAAGVVVHAETRLHSGVSVAEGAVLGRPPRLSPRSSAAGRPVGALLVEADVVIGAGVVVLAGARIGSGARLAEGAYVRERAELGARSALGPGACVDNDVSVDEGVDVGAGAYLTAGTLVEAGAVVGPGVITTNDHTMARHPADDSLVGATLRRGCRVGEGAILLPGIEVGAEAEVVDASVVTRNVAPGARVAGAPARPVAETD
jgi:acetyltransferase-like isoleucine patch superfamily enzyme